MTQTSQNTVLVSGLREIVDNADATKAFGTPITQEGTIMLPVAKIAGGGGGGGGTGPAEAGRQAEGTGGGFGLTAKALGVYVLRDGKVKWLPAVDVNKIIMGGQLVAVAGMLLARALLRPGSTPRTRLGIRPRKRLAALKRRRRAASGPAILRRLGSRHRG